jgi:hypothetical protein
MNKITINSKHEKQIDAASLSWCEMALLKKRDPFMYYSIPGNRDTRKIQGKDVDLADMKISRCPGVRRRSIQVLEFVGPSAKVPSRRTSITALDDHTQKEVHKTLEPEESHPNIVKRKSAISFESYGDLDDVMDEMSQEMFESQDSAIGTMRRESIMQDFFFFTIALLNEELINSDEESEY